MVINISKNKIKTLCPLHSIFLVGRGGQTTFLTGRNGFEEVASSEERKERHQKLGI
jgi:hypothetical protein